MQLSGMKLSVVTLSGATTLVISIALALAASAGDDPSKPGADDGNDVAVPEGAVTFEGHRYLLVDEVEELSWAGGQAVCESWGGHLAVVTSAAEAGFIADLCDGRYMFLGATDQAEEGVWVWVDGTPWEFTHWMKGQPNDYGGSEDYLATYDGGEWVDVEGQGEAFWMPTGFICEWSD